MVEECDVATFGNHVEEDQGLVKRPEADPWAVVLVLVVSPVDIDTLVKQPVDRLLGVGVIPGRMLAMFSLHVCLTTNCKTQCPVPLMSQPNSTRSLTSSIDSLMHLVVAQTAGLAPFSSNNRISGRSSHVSSRHAVASAAVIEPLARSSATRWMSSALQAECSSRLTSESGSLLTPFVFAPGLVLAILGVGSCTTS
jgi:hypothetical protein